MCLCMYTTTKVFNKLFVHGNVHIKYDDSSVLQGKNVVIQTMLFLLLTALLAHTVKTAFLKYICSTFWKEVRACMLLLVEE